uniref:Uncharacterized protein n=1 Tax=Glossina pallidipes TaxID=7398 RepID=A0A1B0A959_GLOPL
MHKNSAYQKGRLTVMMAKHCALLNKLGVKDLNCGDVTFTKFPFELVEHTSVSGVIITDKIIAKAAIIPAP